MWGKTGVLLWGGMRKEGTEMKGGHEWAVRLSRLVVVCCFVWSKVYEGWGSSFAG